MLVCYNKEKTYKELLFMKIGVIHSCFRTDVKEALRLANQLGLSGVQIYATRGEFSPWTLSDEDIEEYKNLLAKYNLEVSALCGDMGGFGFEVEEDNPEKVEKTCRIVDLAVKLGTKVITTHIGIIPDDKNDPQYDTMLRALRACGKYAHEHGVTLAIETGPEKATTLHQFVMDCGDGVGVNLDPANFVMVTGQDPAEAVRLLGSKIVHTHLKDGIMVTPADPSDIYGHSKKPHREDFDHPEYYRELPIGQGAVKWDEYIGALREVGFDGYLTIEREVGSTPYEDVKLARDYVIEHNYL